MKRAYRLCLILYPRAHRDQFGEEMMQVFEEAAAEGRGQGWSWSVRFALAEIAGLIGGAAGAWLDRNNPRPAAVQSSEQRMPLELLQAQRAVEANIAAMVQAIANHQFERARLLSDQERIARANLHTLREKYGIDDSPGHCQCS